MVQDYLYFDRIIKDRSGHVIGKEHFIAVYVYILTQPAMYFGLSDS